MKLANRNSSISKLSWLAVASKAAVAMMTTLALSAPASAQFLDKKYPLLPHPAESTGLNGVNYPPSSNALNVANRISAVRSQGKRGTCSIFSSTAMLEALLSLDAGLNKDQVDLSEEWLEYLIVRTRQDDGSTSSANYAAMKRWGMPKESSLPYIGEEWENLDSNPLARARCEKVQGPQQKSCLLAHRAPALLDQSDFSLSNPQSPFYDLEFLTARKEAVGMRNRYLPAFVGGWINGQDQVKALLASGHPVLLDLDFYYGAWNHREADNLGIGRDMGAWSRGEVGYPEVGSIDREKSLTDPAGHSILVVGYDDNAEVKTTVKMKDGSTKTFTYRGVYYFKNSWGTSNFGVETNIQGQRLPGYGIITQKYSHEFGGFYNMRIK